MALKSGLALYAYVPGGSVGPEYSSQIENLTFTNVSPGGMGDLDCLLKLPDARLARAELANFSRVALMDGPLCLLVGEITDPEYGMDETHGEYVRVMALGLGATLRDDPRGDSYVNQTPKQIISSQMSTRSTWLVIDADTSQVFPDNPSAVFSPAYPGRNMEEIVADVATLAGDYSWGVWPHPNNRDANNFPTGQLVIHQRDTTTTSYTASVAARDVVGWRITPSGERAFNYIEIGYNDPTQSPPIGHVTYKDSRLAANNSQGTAPFRFRKFLRDYAGIATITKAQAQSIANTYGALYQNITSKIEITLRAVRDAYGNPINPWQVQADRNIFVPELAVRGTQLATSIVPGTNQFYILEARYSETAAGDQQVTIRCDNWIDRAALRIARLQLEADTLARQGAKRAQPAIAQGAPATGRCGGTHQASGGSQVFGEDTSYAATLSASPTSVSLTQVAATNATGAGVSNLSANGFTVFWSSSGAGLTEYHAEFRTNGNCLLGVDGARGTFDHHCDGCEARGLVAVRRGLALGRDLAARAHPSGDPGQHSMVYTCPTCGMVEGFHTGLLPEDEQEQYSANGAFRAGQARLIRQAQTALGLSRHEPPAGPGNSGPGQPGQGGH